MENSSKECHEVETEVVSHKETQKTCEHDGEVLELVVVEELVRKKKTVPIAKKYRIRIEKREYDVSKPIISGRELLELAGKDPAEWKIYQIRPGHQPSQVRPEQTVDLRAHGIERFSLLPCDSRDGLTNGFQLPASDRKFLEGIGLSWQAQVDGQVNWLILENWELPPGYNHSHVRIALRIPPSYPDGELDMVYVHPPLARQDGRAIAALSNHKGCGVVWQRWSRHRTKVNPWRPGVDDLASHLSLVGLVPLLQTSGVS